MSYQWRRSTKCSTNSCVEVSDLPEGWKAVRDSKAGRTGPVLLFTAEEWNTFARAVKAGEFD
ncbi:MAG TPA: DUF397 domain-containing protein [Streptosporangiaceae bacterium]|nr:DUF397 domain-containing protein [Streptosporangiaceae bacterium]